MIKEFFTEVGEFLDAVVQSEDKPCIAAKAAYSSAVGGVAGGTVIAATGLTAAGMVGGGAGIGCAAGPVGVAVGALAGLAIYGVKRMCS